MLAALADRGAEREPGVTLALAVRTGRQVALDGQAICRGKRPGRQLHEGVTTLLA